MDFGLFAAFVAATVVLIALPGPNVALIVANSLALGARGGLMTVAGTSSAMVVQLLVTAAGMTSAIAFLAEGFAWLKWAGVAYLIYLGIRMWRTNDPETIAADAGGVRPSTVYWRGFLVSATNPKTLFFYAAFFPQFIDPGYPPELQIAVLSLTFLVVATVLDSAYALAGGRFRGLLAGPGRARLRNRLSGSLLIGAGVGLALARRS